MAAAYLDYGRWHKKDQGKQMMQSIMHSTKPFRLCGFLIAS